MAKWYRTYKAIPNIGVYGGDIFQPPTIEDYWYWVHYASSGLGRQWVLEATYGHPYIGGSPASGTEISYSECLAFSNDSNNPTELFAMKFSKDLYNNGVALVIKAYQLGESQLVGKTVLSVRVLIYKRVYTDENTYTETLVGNSETSVYKEDGGVTPTHTFLEFYKYESEYFVGISNWAISGQDILSFYNLWNPTEEEFEEAVSPNDAEGTGEFSPEFGPASDIDGGYNDGFPHGSFDDSSDEIALDAKPTVGVSTAGFIRCYKVSQGDLDNFGEKLFPDPESVAVTERLWFTMAYSKLIDYVIDCHVIPTAITGGTLENLKVGWKTFNDISLVRLTEDYVDVDCGSIEIDEYWRNFLDFASCSCEIYLPFIGYVPIESEYWNGGKIHLIYRFNLVDGSFQAKLFSDSSKSKLKNSLIGQYGGVCCLHLPITGLQYANVITGILSAGTGVALDVQSGNYGNIPNQLSSVLSLKPDLAMSNSYSATTSFLTHRTPYLVIKRAVAQFSKKYNLENGFPLNVAKPLSSISGFTIIDNPRLNIDCTDEEYNEIVNLLKTGVIF